MDSTRQIPWLRISAEGAAIVVSILLAFAIDAWWEERQDRVELRGMLVAVLDELRASKKYVDQARILSQEQQDSFAQLLAVAYGQTESADEAEIDGLLKNLNWSVGYMPIVTASLNRVTSSDNFGLIKQVELRENLADLSLDIDYLQNDITAEADYYQGAFLPFMRKNSNWAQIDAAHDRYPGNAAFQYPDFPLSPPGGMAHSRLLADNEFQNLLFFGWEAKVDLMLALNFADSKLDKTIELLERELGL